MSSHCLRVTGTPFSSNPSGIGYLGTKGSFGLEILLDDDIVTGLECSSLEDEEWKVEGFLMWRGD